MQVYRHSKLTPPALFKFLFTAGRDEPSRPLVIRPGQLILSLWVFVIGLITVNGFFLYFLDLPSNPWLILGLILLEALVGCVWLARQGIKIEGDSIELAGFMLIVTGFWLYLVAPSWPTLLPPSPAGDAANHAAYANTIYFTGRLFPDYPAGPALVIATWAHWIGWLPLRLLHPAGSLFLALTAGAVYGLLCQLLPNRREYKVVALLSLWALLVPWGFFSGMLIGHDYFLTQAAAQFLVTAFVGFLGSYLDSYHPAWLLLLMLCVIGISVAWQLWVILPLAIMAWCLAMELKDARLTVAELGRALLFVLGGLAAFWVTLLLTSHELVPSLGRLSTSTGSILDPSFEQLGGAFLILPALGLLTVFGSGYKSRAATAFVILSLVQTLAMLGAHFELGLATYYTNKVIYLLVIPMAVAAGVGLARGMEVVHALTRRRVMASKIALGAVIAILAADLLFFLPDPSQPPLGPTDVDAALWAAQHLKTSNVNVLGRKSLQASWIGVGIWGEKYARDLFVDLAALGPKTFDEWRDNSDWGDFLLVMSRQDLPNDPTLTPVFQEGSSVILRKPQAPDPAFGPARARFGQVFQLDSSVPRLLTIRPDQVISFTAQIRTLGFPDNEMVWRLQLRDLLNRPVAESRNEPFDGEFPLQRWPLGKVIPQPFAIQVPPSIEPGLYHLQLGLYHTGFPDAVPAETESGSEDVVQLASIKVPVRTLTQRDMDSVSPVTMTLGEEIELMGYTISPSAALLPGENLTLSLYWKGIKPISQDYHVFVHLLDAAGGVRAQRDGQPRDGDYPTSIWEVNEVVMDSYTLSLPSDLRPGSYHLEVGMYSWPDLKRLPVVEPIHRPLGDHLVLPIEIQIKGS